MERSYSLEFAAARKAHAEALAAFENEHDGDLVDDPINDAIEERWHDALHVMMAAPALTVGDLRAKFDAGRELLPSYRAEIDRDLLALRRPASTLHAPFQAWRDAYEAHVLGTDFAEEEDVCEDRKDQLIKASADAFHALLAAPCASPADMMVKLYADAMLNIGHTMSGSARKDGTGNLWDIAIAEVDHITVFHDAWQRSAYHDLDQSDLGACLLAFGRLDFSAADWVARSRAVGLPVRLGLAEDGESLSLTIGMYDAGCDERQTRERNRLRRLLNFDPSRERMVRREILHNWPDLVNWRTEPLPEPEDAVFPAKAA